MKKEIGQEIKNRIRIKRTEKRNREERFSERHI
jgi:hypothetical protein